MINGQQALDALRAVVDIRGADFIYTDEDGVQASADGDAHCTYVHGRGTDDAVAGCAVGVVHSNLFGEHVDVSVEGQTPGLLGEPVWVNEVALAANEFWSKRYTDGARQILTFFQQEQDGGAPYGEALSATVQYVMDDEIDLT